MGGHGPDLSFSGYGLTAGCCKHDKSRGSIMRKTLLVDEPQIFACQEGLWSIELVSYSVRWSVNGMCKYIYIYFMYISNNKLNTLSQTFYCVVILYMFGHQASIFRRHYTSSFWCELRAVVAVGWLQVAQKTASVVPPEDGRLTPKTCRELWHNKVFVKVKVY
jgi:hypothetical protein